MEDRNPKNYLNFLVGGNADTMANNALEYFCNSKCLIQMNNYLTNLALTLTLDKYSSPPIRVTPAICFY